MSQTVFDNGGIIGKTQYLFDTKPYIPAINPESGLILTRTIASGSTTSSFSSTERTQPAVFSCNITFPVTPTDCVLFRAGGSTAGCWVGLRDSGTKFRIRAGGGGTVGGSNSTTNIENESTTTAAVLDIFDFPRDNVTHNVTWEFSVSLGRVRLWIDGVFKGESFTSAGGVLGADSTWAGTTSPGYILAGSSVSNEPTVVWGGADQGGGLRYYANQTVPTNSANFYGNSKNSGIWSLQSIHDSINNKPTVTYIGTTTDVADLPTYNTAFTNLSIGGPGLIVVGIQSETTTAGSSISTCSIGGLIPTTFIDNKMQSTNNSSLVHTALAAVRIASGTTTNIEVGFSATQLRCSVSIWRITNNKSDQPIDIRTSGFSNGSGKSITFKNMVKNAVGVALYTTGSAGSTSPTWTNASMRYDLDIESGGTRISGADFIIPGNSNYLISTNHSTSSGQPIGLTGAVWR